MPATSDDYFVLFVLREQQRALEERLQTTSETLHALGAGSGNHGLTPDTIKSTSAYRQAKTDCDNAFAALRKFNGKHAHTLHAAKRREASAKD